MAYSLPTNLTYDSGYVDWMQWTNSVTDGYFGLLVLVVAFLICWVSISYTDKSQNALIGSMFVTFVIGLLLWLMGLLATHWLVILVLMVAVSAFYGMRNDLT